MGKKPTPNKAAINKVCITPEEAAERYGLNIGTLANLRSKKLGCPYFKVNRKILYRIDQFENWVFSEPVRTLDSIEG